VRLPAGCSSIKPRKMFGKFQNIEEFLNSYVKHEEQKRMEFLHSLSLEEQIAVLSTVQPTDLAEVKATIKERESDDKSSPKHYQMIVVLDEIIKSSPDIKNDIQLCKKNHLPVFVAVRYGDRQGITQPITSGMGNGDKMHFKGQWITRDKASQHGGEKMSVLHFTHHPVGFTCTLKKCYS
jgi:endonuclease G